MYTMCTVKKLSQTYIVKYSIHIIIVRKQKKNALAGTPTTAIFLAAILYEQVFLYLNVNLFHYQDHLTPLKAVKGYDSYTVIFVGEISPIIITEKRDYDYVKLIGLIAGIYRMVSMISPIYIVCGTRPWV